jgi:hypothetical protein
VRATRRVRGLALLALVSSCAGGAEPIRRGAVSESTPRTSPTTVGPQPQPSEAHAAVAVAVEDTPTLLITDTKVLAALEQQGLSLTTLFGVAEPNNRGLAASPGFAPLVTELAREVKQAKAADPLAGVEVARYAHRLFDVRFLSSPHARFVLAGVVNRPDRAPFGLASCGETRLIYRLSYALDAERASKLPMTLGVELTVPRGARGCRDAATPATSPEARASWLRSVAGPLAPALTQVRRERAQVVVNVQLVRWPSTVRPDLGGHAEYLLRAFRPDGAGLLTAEKLENTVEPSDFRAPQRRLELERWLVESAERVDDGTAVLPTALLAERALSVTPRGLSRLANRPFSRALGAPAGLSTSSRFVKSSAGLLRRLDELSCPGCHQARSVAGFHLLGEDAPEAPAENALALPTSPHVTGDLPRRLRIARQMLYGEEPDYAAPFAERTGSGRYGEACGLGSDPTFATWNCDAGLKCSAIGAVPGDVVGQCLPPQLGVGDACEEGGVRTSEDRLRDRMNRVQLRDCPDMVCNRSSVGFPGGMCTAACGTAGTSCGAIAILEPFNACLARGESFLSCVRGNVRPAGLRRCDAQEPCRDDYVCAKAAGNAGSEGVCLPPYFVFQLRVDGHSSGLR